MSDADHAGALTAIRIVRAGYPVFDGTGAARWGGRWTSPGKAAIHEAESYALAVLENLVHFNASELPPSLVITQIEIPARVSREIIRRSDIADFDSAATYESCRAIGDRWHQDGKSALLIVPARLDERLKALLKKKRSKG